MSDGPGPDVQPMLFVYGTLMSRFDNPHARALRQAATPLGPAWLPGRMYRVSGPGRGFIYPAVIPSTDPADQVHGELLRLEDLRVLERLDHYEGYAPTDPAGSEYCRELGTVRRRDQPPVEAWYYRFAGSIRAEWERVASGRFRG